MSQYPPFRAAYIHQVEHPTARVMVPRNPDQMVHGPGEFEEQVVKYWTAEIVKITSYQDINDRLGIIDIVRASKDVSIYVGDMSAVDGSPINPLATAVWVLAGSHGNTSMGSPMPGVGKPFLLHGPVLVAGGVDDSGYDTDIFPWVRETITRAVTRCESELRQAPAKEDTIMGLFDE